jgi:hypothetical protein
MKIQKNKKKTGSYHFRIKTLMMSIYKITVKAKKVVPIVIAMKNHLKKTKKIIQIVHNKKNNEEN